MTNKDVVKTLMALRADASNTQMYVALSAAIAAVNLQEAKAPKIIPAEYEDGYELYPATLECPSCGEDVDMELHTEFCPNCGQHIDWSVMEDDFGY